MNRLIAFVILGLVAGCASAVDSPAKAVFQLRSGYVAVLTVAEGYEGLPRCPETVEKLCSDPDVVDVIRKADLTAKDALDAAELTVRSHPEVNAEFAIAAAENAVDAMRSILATYQIGSN